MRLSDVNEAFPAIYLIEEISTGFVYVGQTTNYWRRLVDHARDVGRYGGSGLKEAFTRSGLEGLHFEVVERCSVEELLDKELFWLKKFRPEDVLNVRRHPEAPKKKAPEKRVMPVDLKRGKIRSGNAYWRRYLRETSR